MEWAGVEPGSEHMIRATWNGAIVAESDHTVTVEGNHYFPPDSVRMEYLADSESHTRCPWKGKASYYNLVVDGKENPDAAWYYPKPTRAAARIAGHVAFWHGVSVERDTADSTEAKRSVLARLLHR